MSAMLPLRRLISVVFLQALSAIGVGLAYPGGQSGAPYLAGPTPVAVEGIGFVKAELNNYWLVNNKGFVVRSFDRKVTPAIVSEWVEGKSLPLGTIVPDPRKTITILPQITPLGSWTDLMALGMRFARQAHVKPLPLEKGILILFLSTYGPADHLYVERLNIIYEEAKKSNVQMIALFPGKAETKASIARFSSLHNLKFDCALDSGNAYADAYRATRTPEAYLLDQGLRVVYTGAIDESTFGGESTRRYLLDALREHAGGAKIANAVTRVFGTPIDR